MTRQTTTGAPGATLDPLGATLRGGDGSFPMKTDLQTLLEKLESFSPEAEAAACLAAAKRFATMKRIVFDTRIAGLMATAETDGERQALEGIRRRGPRQFARLLLEEARDLGEGGALRVAREELIGSLRKRLH